MKNRILPVVLLLIVSITAVMVSCEDSPITRVRMVAESGGEYSTIQAAIDGSDNGDTIVVAAGTYIENINIDKPLTLKAGATGVVVDGLVQINAKKVLMEGIKVNPKTGITGITGIDSIPKTPDTQRVGIFVGAMAEVSFDAIEVQGEGSRGAGIKIMPGAKVSVKNSTFKDLQTGIFVHIPYEGISKNARVSLFADSNSFTNNKAGIGGTESSDVTITNNTFVTIAPGGEGIGLGVGVRIFNAEGIEINPSDLEGANTFEYTEGYKVADYRTLD